MVLAGANVVNRAVAVWYAIATTFVPRNADRFKLRAEPRVVLIGRRGVIKTGSVLIDAQEAKLSAVLRAATLRSRHALMDVVNAIRKRGRTSLAIVMVPGLVGVPLVIELAVVRGPLVQMLCLLCRCPRGGILLELDMVDWAKSPGHRGMERDGPFARVISVTVALCRRRIWDIRVPRFRFC